MKATILLAIALFLATAPEPESKDIAELTAGFIVLDQAAHLQAAEISPANQKPGAELDVQKAAVVSSELSPTEKTLSHQP